MQAWATHSIMQNKVEYCLMVGATNVRGKVSNFCLCFHHCLRLTLVSLTKSLSRSVFPCRDIKIRLSEQHRNMYIIKCETDRQPRLDAWDKCSGLVHWDDPEGWGGRWEGGSGWGIHVNPWLIHVNVWQKPLQYCKVISLQLIKINGKIK